MHIHALITDQIVARERPMQFISYSRDGDSVFVMVKTMKKVLVSFRQCGHLDRLTQVQTTQAWRKLVDSTVVCEEDAAVGKGVH